MIPWWHSFESGTPKTSIIRLTFFLVVSCFLTHFLDTLFCSVLSLVEKIGTFLRSYESLYKYLAHSI